MTVIDVHNHYYPPAFIDALRAGTSALKVSDDAEGNPVLYSPGDANIAVRGHRDIAYREEVLASRKAWTASSSRSPAPAPCWRSPARVREAGGAGQRRLRAR